MVDQDETFSIKNIFLHLGTPKSMEYSKVKTMLKDAPGVMMVHSLHIWSLNVDKHCLTAHLAIGENICTFIFLIIYMQYIEDEETSFTIKAKVGLISQFRPPIFKL